MAEPPDAMEPSVSQTASVGVGTESLTTSYAVRAEHAVRAQALLRVVMLTAALGVVALQLPRRDSPGRWLATGVLAGCSLLAAGQLWTSRKRELRSVELVLLGLYVTITILVALYHVGPFSAVIMTLFVALYFFGLGDVPGQAWTVFLLGSIGYLTLAVLSMFGVIDLAQPVFALQKVELASLLALTTVTQVFLGLTFWLARQSRAATLEAMSELERAHRQIRQREALLAEARADLDKALDAGRLGRLTGREVGPYVAEEVIGRGAMGEVYAAHHAETGDAVALKVLHPWIVDEPPLLERFFREAEVSSRLESPHIVRVLDFGRAFDGSPYLAMERLDGHDLGWHLRESRRFGARQTLDLVTQVAQALTVAQDAAIVHRDLKPQNLFLLENDRQKLWKVLDFGVSKISHASGMLTRGSVVGTPSYMAPEQARGAEVDHRADVFALGVIAYRALTGRPAFQGEDAAITMYNVCHLQPTRPSDLVRLDSDVELVLALALAKDRARRLPSAATFAAALRDAIRNDLDERLRRDAKELLQKHPWGIDDTATEGSL